MEPNKPPASEHSRSPDFSHSHIVVLIRSVLPAIWGGNGERWKEPAPPFCKPTRINLWARLGGRQWQLSGRTQTRSGSDQQLRDGPQLFPMPTCWCALMDCMATRHIDRCARFWSRCDRAEQDYALLDLPEVKAVLAHPPVARGLTRKVERIRALYDCPELLPLPRGRVCA